MTDIIHSQQHKQGRLEEKKEFPKVILIDTISFCNLKCTMCVHRNMTRKKGVMPWNLFTKIIDEIAVTDNTVRVWLVFFGEALLLKRGKYTIFDMINYAKKKGLTDLVLNSNANLLDEDAAQKLINVGLDALYIGIDAFTEKTYAKIRVGGDYKQTVENVVRLINIKQEKKSAKPAIFVQFVEMDINKTEKNSFIDFWKGKGITVKIRPKVSWAGAIDADNQKLDNRDRWPCYWAMQTLSITDQGKIVTCAVDVDAQWIVGDIKKNSIKEIWNGPLKVFRRMHLQKQFNMLPDHCCACRDWQSARADFYSQES